MNIFVRKTNYFGFDMWSMFVFLLCVFIDICCGLSDIGAITSLFGDEVMKRKVDENLCPISSYKLVQANFHVPNGYL